MKNVNMTYSKEQWDLIKKYKEEFLKNKENKRLVDEAKGGVMENFGLKKRDREKVKKAEDAVKYFIKQVCGKDPKVEKKFEVLDGWFDALVDELGLPGSNN